MAHRIARISKNVILLGAWVALVALPGCIVEEGDIDDELLEEWDEPDVETEKFVPALGVAPPNQPVILNEAHLCEMRCSGGYTNKQKQCLPLGSSCVFNLPVWQTCQFSDTIIGSC